MLRRLVIRIGPILKGPTVQQESRENFGCCIVKGVSNDGLPASFWDCLTFEDGTRKVGSRDQTGCAERPDRLCREIR